MTFKARITAIKDVVAALGLMFTMAVLLGSALVFLIVGAWDGAVWLFKADWQTTNFQVPFWAFVVFLCFPRVSSDVHRPRTYDGGA